MSNPNPNPDTRIQPGEIRNPSGRGATRDKLTKAFIVALTKDFEQYGEAAIERARNDDANAYLRLIASLQPRHVEIPAGPLSDAPYEKLLAMLMNLDRLAAADDPQAIEELETMTPAGQA
jgi:hypothetical protein